jgi:hypothetical protein
MLRCEVVEVNENDLLHLLFIHARRLRHFRTLNVEILVMCILPRCSVVKSLVNWAPSPCRLRAF